MACCCERHTTVLYMLTCGDFLFIHSMYTAKLLVFLWNKNIFFVLKIISQKCCKICNKAKIMALSSYVKILIILYFDYNATQSIFNEILFLEIET